MFITFPEEYASVHRNVGFCILLIIIAAFLIIPFSHRFKKYLLTHQKQQNVK